MFESMKRFLSEMRWNYVGVVVGSTRSVREDGTMVVGGESRGYWILEQRGNGARRIKLIGKPGTSAFANEQMARVEAWARGGPLPALERSFQPDSGVRGALVMFPGGKDS